MASLPVDPAAPRAALELIVESGDPRRQHARDLFFGGRLERVIAAHAAGEGTQQPPEIEAPHHLRELAAGSGFAHEIAVRDLGCASAAPHRGSAGSGVRRSKRRPARRRCSSCGTSVSKPAIRRYAASFPRWTSRTKRGSRSGSGRSRVSPAMSSDSKTGYTLMRSPSCDPPVEAARHAVDDHQIYFGVRHAEGLDAVLDGAGVEEVVGELGKAALRGQQVVQLGVEAEPGAGHLATGSPDPPAASRGSRKPSCRTTGRRIRSGPE